MTRIESITSAEATRLLAMINFNAVEQRTMDFCLLMSMSIWAGFVNNELACIWGLIPPTLLSNQAYLWLYTTNVIEEHQFILVRHSQLVVEELLQEYPSIVGHATIGSSKSIRWLKWLGAKFGEPQGLAVPFRITRHDKCA